MRNSSLVDADLVHYAPDHLTGSVREFFCTLRENQTDMLAHFCAAMTAHFDSDSWWQAALQKFYQAYQQVHESTSDYYCRLQELGRTAFSNLDNLAHAQQVLAWMRQGLCPEIRVHSYGNPNRGRRWQPPANQTRNNSYRDLRYQYYWLQGHLKYKYHCKQAEQCKQHCGTDTCQEQNNNTTRNNNMWPTFDPQDHANT